MKVIELFAGVGGFRLGLEAVGSKEFQIVWSNQWEPSTKSQPASEIYEARFGSEGHSNEDIASVIENNFKSDEPGSIMISGTVIADSLKAQFPNEYAKLTFNPTVDVIVDTNQWVIKSVTSRIDTLKLFEIFKFK